MSDSFTIKWPNDLYYRDKKVGGILIENNISSGKITSSVIGVGLNVNQVLFSGLPDAISLRQIFSRSFNLDEIYQKVLQCLENRWLALSQSQLEVLKHGYLERLYGYRQLLKFKVGSQISDGRVEGIDPVGRLVVNVAGEEKKFNFQEIIFLK
jgi:BirA family biotin operon repressor/biotin-[acetyl-CoA-carboxylase] ligase